MTVIKRRDRVIIFRLTQEEYDQLLAACLERGGRNLSDFARSQLFQRLDETRDGSAIRGQLSSVEQHLLELRTSVDRVLEQIEPTKD